MHSLIPRTFHIIVTHSRWLLAGMRKEGPGLAKEIWWAGRCLILRLLLAVRLMSLGRIECNASADEAVKHG